MFSNYNIVFSIFVNNNNTNMDKLKKIWELIVLVNISILSLPFIIITYILIFILYQFESIWKNRKGQDNI